MDKIIIGHITLEMIVSFSLGIIVLFAYCWKNNEEVKKGYGTKSYMKLTFPNIVFHLFSSVLVLWLLHELSEVIITNFIPALDSNKIYHNTLATATGIFGSVGVAKVFEFVRKKQNKIDQNIKHVHDENCDHE